MLAEVRLSSLPVVLACVSMTACHHSYPPARPSGVPAAAAWAGGLDGGGRVTCSGDSADHNTCTIYDEEGPTLGPARYTLKDVARAANTSELKYTYLTGKAIGLKDGLELVRVASPSMPK